MTKKYPGKKHRKSEDKSVSLYIDWLDLLFVKNGLLIKKKQVVGF